MSYAAVFTGYTQGLCMFALHNYTASHMQIYVVIQSTAHLSRSTALWTWWTCTMQAATTSMLRCWRATLHSNAHSLRAPLLAQVPQEVLKVIRKNLPLRLHFSQGLHMFGARVV